MIRFSLFNVQYIDLWFIFRVNFWAVLIQTFLFPSRMYRWLIVNFIIYGYSLFSNFFSHRFHIQILQNLKFKLKFLKIFSIIISILLQPAFPNQDITCILLYPSSTIHKSCIDPNLYFNINFRFPLLSLSSWSPRN